MIKHNKKYRTGEMASISNPLLKKISRFLRRSFAIQAISIRQIVKNFIIHKRYASNNLSKNHVLNVVNKIIKRKSTPLNSEDLIKGICKILAEDFGETFTIILKENKEKLKAYEAYGDKIKQVLQTALPNVINQDKKTIYFNPMSVDDVVIGILITESLSKNSHRNLGLRKILPILLDQISVIIDNFQTHTHLREAKANEEREKLRSLILSSISHDLKTPLFTIIGSLNIFKSLSEKNKLTKANKITLINIALEEAERLNNFISDVLEMTKIESGAIKLDKKLLNPAIILLKVLERFDVQLSEYQLEISLSKKIRINFDQVSFEQIIQNLLDNTLKYSPKNTKITIKDEINRNTYRIFIQDEGPGISPEKLDSIFNKFERFNLGDKAAGNGLGLSIVKALMECNNATISAANSAKGQGAIFILEFKDFVSRNVSAKSSKKL
jgi:K+-sensing histidine kinase KdpD